eukprot:7596510-Lingulodinium_polyedra.AAC.1
MAHEWPIFGQVLTHQWPIIGQSVAKIVANQGPVGGRTLANQCRCPSCPFLPPRAVPSNESLSALR